MNTKVGFIGGGNMATSLLGGLSRPANGKPIICARDIWVYDQSPSKSKTLQAEYGINIGTSNAQLVSQCDVLVIAVKPQVLKQVLRPLSEVFKLHQPLLVSVVAGIQSKTIENCSGRNLAIVRVMPNTPALIGFGASGLFANSQVTAPQRTLAASLLNAVGISVWVDDESDIDLITALSGSGPAYFMLFIQSLVDAAIAAGLDAGSAKRLAVQTAIGSAQLIQRSDQPIETLIKNVTSPGGTTEQALLAFKNANFQAVVATAFSAAKTRSEQMATEFDK